MVTDVEGTVTSIAFVKEVLFPYAKEHLPDFVRANRDTDEVADLLAQARELGGMPNADIEETITLLQSWITQDRKAPPLKALQGMIWQAGYQNGEIKSDIYADAVVALTSWKQQGKRLYVYSSGSIQAQKLIFAHSRQGNLTHLFSGYFDTTIGGKLDAKSYMAIAAELDLPPSAILFLSDHVGELDAAARAGMATICVDRGEAEIPPAHAHATIATFDQIGPL